MTDPKKCPPEKVPPDFSKLAKYVRECAEGLAEDGYPGKDYEHYCFELALEAVYGKNVWKWWNAQEQQ